MALVFSVTFANAQDFNWDVYEGSVKPGQTTEALMDEVYAHGKRHMHSEITSKGAEKVYLTGIIAGTQVGYDMKDGGMDYSVFFGYRPLPWLSLKVGLGMAEWGLERSSVDYNQYYTVGADIDLISLGKSLSKSHTASRLSLNVGGYLGHYYTKLDAVTIEREDDYLHLPMRNAGNWGYEVSAGIGYRVSKGLTLNANFTYRSFDIKIQDENGQKYNGIQYRGSKVGIGMTYLFGANPQKVAANRSAKQARKASRGVNPYGASVKTNK